MIAFTRLTNCIPLTDTGIIGQVISNCVTSVLVNIEKPCRSQDITRLSFPKVKKMVRGIYRMNVIGIAFSLCRPISLL